MKFIILQCLVLTTLSVEAKTLFKRNDFSQIQIAASLLTINAFETIKTEAGDSCMKLQSI